MTQYPSQLPSFYRALLLSLILSCSMAYAQTRQEHIHHMGHSVMPFDLAKTMHVFRMTEAGGVQRVIVKDTSDKDQVTMIRQHLEHEAESFQRGSYSDPASLHGTDMPGLKELQTGARQIKVSYTALPDGAEITFKTTDRRLLTAIHRWFGAQLSEHGADARSE
jgi:hypothetical protein